MALAIAAEADALVPEIGISEKVKVRGLPHRGGTQDGRDRLRAPPSPLAADRLVSRRRWVRVRPMAGLSSYSSQTEARDPSFLPWAPFFPHPITLGPSGDRLGTT
jgi:hypothetical protein